MIILNEVFETINKNVPDFPPETGGIIGSAHGEIIDSVVMDHSDSSGKRKCSYSPNVDFLNSSIATWQKSGIAFKGIFHTHFAGVKTLSCADKHYIDTIMNAMPKSIQYLYFPIFVLPGRRMVCYRAERLDNMTKITSEIVNICD